MNNINLLYQNKKIIYFIFFLNQIYSFRYFLNSSFFNKDITFFYIYLISTFLLFYFFYSRKIIHLFLSDILFYLILFIFFIFLFYNYPTQDSLKFFKLGSDQDNCYTDIIQNIKNKNENIYSLSYLGNPCSTGLLAFLFYFPLLFWNKYFVLVPIIFLLLFKRSNLFFLKDKKLANLLNLFLISNLVFLELAVSGSDFIPIAISYILGNIYLIKGLRIKKKFELLISFLFFLFFFGSRSVLIVLILPLVFIFYHKYKDKIIILFFFTIFAIVLASFIVPYFIFNYFPPVHLINKAIMHIYNVKYLFIILLIILFFFKKSLFSFINKNFFLSILLIILVPFLLGSFSGLINNLNSLSKWEELNYAFIFIPTLFTILIQNLKKND